VAGALMGISTSRLEAREFSGFWFGHWSGSVMMQPVTWERAMSEKLTINRLLLKMKEVQASDLHIKVGSPPVLRLASTLQRIDAPPLDAADTAELLKPLISEHNRQRLEAEGGVDFSHLEGQHERFRCSVFKSGGGLHAAIR